MSLNPQDIVRKEFREAFRGYNQAEVDLFLDEVVEDYSRIHEENQKLKVRVAALQQEVARLREGRAEPAAPSSRSAEEAARLEGEIRGRVRRFLEEQIRLIDAASPGQSATVERIARDVPQPRQEPARRIESQQEREPFWAGE